MSWKFEFTEVVKIVFYWAKRSLVRKILYFPMEKGMLSPEVYRWIIFIWTQKKRRLWQRPLIEKKSVYLVSLILLSSRRHDFGAFTVTIRSSISDNWAFVIAHTFSWSIIILVALSHRPSFRSNNSFSWTKR